MVPDFAAWALSPVASGTVPAGDAVNRAVAVLRRGTIPTEHALAPEALVQPFVPDDPRHREHARLRSRFLLAETIVRRPARVRTIPVPTASRG